ncbi:glutaredoxin family protein [Beduini massiliensis]|uniref:glutaredoxin family protein n=1 Tax=Beduini massiliensis TaxID=1585974 RepID=UPI00059A8CA3|nr:thioredoxin family protein [Beduini massiliensis]
MKKTELFYLKNCPYCKQAIRWMNELKADPKYADIQIKMIEESEEAAYADAHDYYYVPTFFIDDVKVHEGAATKEQIEEVLNKSL